MEKSKDISACKHQSVSAGDTAVECIRCLCLHDSQFQNNMPPTCKEAILQRSHHAVLQFARSMSQHLCHAKHSQHQACKLPRDDTLKSSLKASDTESTSQGWRVHAAKPAQNRMQNLAVHATKGTPDQVLISLIPHGQPLLHTSILPTYTRRDQQIRHEARDLGVARPSKDPIHLQSSAGEALQPRSPARIGHVLRVHSSAKWSGRHITSALTVH
jgi:hypothetical protein